MIGDDELAALVVHHRPSAVARVESDERPSGRRSSGHSPGF